MPGCHSSAAFAALMEVTLSQVTLDHAGCAVWWSPTSTRATPLNCPWQTGLVLFSGSSNTETQQAPGPPAVPVYPSALCHLSQHHCFPVAWQAAAWIPCTPSVRGPLVALHGVCLVIGGICLKMQREHFSCRWCDVGAGASFPWWQKIAAHETCQLWRGWESLPASVGDSSTCSPSSLPAAWLLLPVFQLPLLTAFVLGSWRGMY